MSKPCLDDQYLLLGMGENDVKSTNLVVITRPATGAFIEAYGGVGFQSDVVASSLI